MKQTDPGSDRHGGEGIHRDLDSSGQKGIINQLMETRIRLETTLKEAMRSGDELRKQNVRMVLSAIRMAEIEKGAPLDEAGVISVVQKEIKSRQESLQDAEKAGRTDLVGRAKSEIEFLQSFLPQQMNEEEIAALAQAAIMETGASGLPDMGKVMKALMPKLQGRATGDQLSQVVRRMLQK